ncbi:DUF4012 domain-containing protein [Nocardioides sp. 616]|uniref:DUF4012 domain-containing protein n=1 Tax=Nocardioides sp. 616 TaxID=2268090 RepID=UPI000CE3FCA5|nr:DUF4012 domain-containing protein [Nocardioides sp. 616]
MSKPRSSGRRSSGRRRVAWGIGVLLLIVAALALLALPFRGVQADADAARAELTAAVEAMKTGDMDVAAEHVASARSDVDEVRDVTNGVSGRVWSLVPVAGATVRDVRHVADAMHEVTGALEIVTAMNDDLSGGNLFTGGDVDLTALDQVLSGVHDIDAHLSGALDELEQVDDEDRFLGSRTADARDEALAEVEPAQKAVEEFGPLVDLLPQVLGADGERKYVVAMLNPAEMRYSGGAALSFAPLSFDDGRMTRGRVADTETQPRAFRTMRWPRVEGNPFHRYSKLRLLTANLAPSWPVSGEEMLRGWAQAKKYDPDGLIVVDVVALARLLETTGPLTIPEVGEVGAEELVELTIGSYDEFDLTEQARRKAVNRALIPAFMDRLLGGAPAVPTIRALASAADSRHFSLYFRDGQEQDAVTKIGFDGDLSDTPHDYLGVFTQNQVPAKSDLWQRKVISSDVRLNKDGSAKVRLSAEVRNEAPALPAGVPVTDFTNPDLDTSIAAFLPEGAAMRAASLRGVAFDPELFDYYGRPYLTQGALIRAGESALLELEYDVPKAAILKDDVLEYGLAIDPHPTVMSESLRVRVQWPKGFRPAELPEGWTKTGPRGATYATDALDGSHEWTLQGLSRNSPR